MTATGSVQLCLQLVVFGCDCSWCVDVRMCVPQVCHQLSSCACSFVQSALGDDILCPRLHSLCSSTVNTEVTLTEHMYRDKSFASNLYSSCELHTGGAVNCAVSTLLHLGAIGT